MKAALPGNEEDRLRALEQTGLLDSRPEDDFDSLARLASVVCNTPIALVSFVDGSRQWFKARVGLDARETSRDIAFCAHTILQTGLFLVEDALLDPRFSKNPLVTGDLGMRFYAGIPLRTSDDLPVGTLCVIDRSPRALSASQTEGLRLLAEQASKQINLRRQQNLLRQTIATTTIVEQELRKAQTLFHAFMDHAPFMALMKDREGRFVYYNQQFADRFGITREAWLGEYETEMFPAESAEHLRANDISVLREWKTLIVDEPAYTAEKHSAWWRSYKFPFRDMEGREYVAGFAVDVTQERAALQQIQRYQEALVTANERLHSQAVTDDLTGLLNRRAFESTLEREFASWQRYGHPLSLMILDIDDFKSINDSLGHEEGDGVLRQVAAELKRCVRGTDVAARYGGEEFAVLLPNTVQEAAMESAERLRLAIRECRVERHGISVSIGVSALSGDTCTKQQLMRSADAAMYRAKREGKDRVCLE